jgi:MoaA/NifB/PqqE/SkfB family radical SAM enzyme
LLQRSFCGDALGFGFGDVELGLGADVLVFFLDEEPVDFVIAAASRPVHPDERPATLQFLAVENKLEFSSLIILARVANGFPLPAAPEHDGAAAVLAFGDDAFERAIIKRVIFDLYGEPFLRRDILEVGAANPDSFFQVFTNGTLLTDASIERLAEIGNVAPVFSIEGDRHATDERRGVGVFDRTMETMDRLGKAGLALGYSATVTRRNFRYLMSVGFFDAMIAKGCIMGWNFLYMPVGRDPDMDLMLTPAERNEFRETILALRKSKPLAALDFWGDSVFVGGCIAGKWYAHVNSEGWVEPCIFTHFATHNLNECTLEEALTSDYFREIQKRQPFNGNLLMPCMLIDNPHESREIVRLTGARPTHPGAESILDQLAPAIDEYADAAERVYAPIWSRMAASKEAEGRAP